MTDATASAETVALFEAERRRLTGLAYRMLGSLADAEDVLQDAWLRWQRTDRATVERPAAFLTAVVTRLSLDRLKSARARRETYVGSWLPEPLLEGADLAIEPEAEIAADLSVALLLALERLSPLERAAFLLHDIFEQPFSEVARILDREEGACRVLANRARQHVQLDRARFPLPPAEGERFARAFAAASKTGDLGELQGLLAENAVLTADGGGKKPAVPRPMVGRGPIARFFARIAAAPNVPPVRRRRFLPINGLPGFLTEYADGHLQTTALEIEGGRIAAIYVVRNPDKLERLRVLLDEDADSRSP